MITRPFSKSSGSLAPIIVFAFNRPEHLARTLAALAACPEASSSALTIYCDGARRPNDEEGVAAVREWASTASGFASVKVVCRERNWGLAASIIAGVSEQLSASNEVIVLEDDILVSPHFLSYMNRGLDLYALDERVASVHGYVYPVAEALPETFFLRGADCWGWATWARAWAHFEADGAKLLRELHRRRSSKHFDFDGQYPYTGMLEDQIAGRNNSWAIRWHASCYLKNLFTLYPGRTLVQNIGHDASGTHCQTTDAMGGEPTQDAIAVDAIPVVESIVGRAAFVRLFSSQRSWKRRLRDSVRRAMRIHA